MKFRRLGLCHNSLGTVIRPPMHNPFRKRFLHLPSYQRALEPTTRDGLGLYIYALLDPIATRPFYVGQGRKERPNGHLLDTLRAERGQQKHSDKTREIVSIWRQGRGVEIVFLRHNLAAEALDDIEGSIISALSLVSGIKLKNQNRGNKFSERGMLTLEQVNSKFASPVNPGSHQAVIVLNIGASLAEGKSDYDATRGDWRFGAEVRNLDAIAVGLENGVGKCAFRVTEWQRAGDKWAFTGNRAEAHDLIGKNWSAILQQNPSWLRNGGRLVIQFDGKGSYRTLWGSTLKDWRSVPV